MNELNERIEQLAEEADEYAEQTVHYYQGQFDGLTWEGKIKQTRDTKFAELIVKECLDVINQPNGVGDDDVIRISNDIEQHFGVEE